MARTFYPAEFSPHLKLTDLNGKVWDFSDGECGVELVSVAGLSGAAFTFDTTSGVNQAGVTVLGRVDKESYTTLKVQVLSPVLGAPAVAHMREWLDGLGRGLARDGDLMTLEVTESERFQLVRLAEQYADPNFHRMWHTGMVVMDVKVQSDESWWRTEPHEAVFEPAEFAAATVINAGDVDSWPWWRVDGPISDLVLGVDGEEVPVPITLGAGEWMEIQTDPDEWAVRDHTGTDRTWDVGDRWYRKVPSRRDDVPVTITGSGTTSATKVKIIVPQLFHGAL